MLSGYVYAPIFAESVKLLEETRGIENLHHEERYSIEEEKVIVSKVCRSFTPASSTEKISVIGLSDDEISEKENSTTHHSSSKSPRGDSISGSKTPNATFNCTETTRVSRLITILHFKVQRNPLKDNPLETRKNVFYMTYLRIMEMTR